MSVLVHSQAICGPHIKSFGFNGLRLVPGIGVKVADMVLRMQPTNRPRVHTCCHASVRGSFAAPQAHPRDSVEPSCQRDEGIRFDDRGEDRPDSDLDLLVEPTAQTMGYRTVGFDRHNYCSYN